MGIVGAGLPALRGCARKTLRAAALAVFGAAAAVPALLSGSWLLTSGVMGLFNPVGTPDQLAARGMGLLMLLLGLLPFAAAGTAVRRARTRRGKGWEAATVAGILALFAGGIASCVGGMALLVGLGS
ncbi:hypothetical protein [Streptomyces sp. NPDC060194]|uniref:hypothetical protein n=1 Tax=Streptomyces sp. NPDC060194 TaxID=3347069 RepID=UPI003648BE50